MSQELQKVVAKYERVAFMDPVTLSLVALMTAGGIYITWALDERRIKKFPGKLRKKIEEGQILTPDDHEDIAEIFRRMDGKERKEFQKGMYNTAIKKGLISRQEAKELLKVATEGEDVSVKDLVKTVKSKFKGKKPSGKSRGKPKGGKESAKAPKGYKKVPGSKKGAYRRPKKGGGYEYWYPKKDK